MINNMVRAWERGYDPADLCAEFGKTYILVQVMCSPHLSHKEFEHEMAFHAQSTLCEYVFHSWHQLKCLLPEVPYALRFSWRHDTCPPDIEFHAQEMSGWEYHLWNSDEIAKSNRPQAEDLDREFESIEEEANRVRRELDTLTGNFGWSVPASEHSCMQMDSYVDFFNQRLRESLDRVKNYTQLNYSPADTKVTYSLYERLADREKSIAAGLKTEDNVRCGTGPRPCNEILLSGEPVTYPPTASNIKHLARKLVKETL
jgi:hypothetical protein